MTEPLTVVCWKWTPPPERQGTCRFEAQHVNTVHAMFRRHYQGAARFVCVTDEPQGLSPDIEALPVPADAARLGSLPSPRGVRFPSSYRRLWNFSAEAREVLGPRIFAIDIDIVFTNDLSPLFNASETFVSWWDERFTPKPLNPRKGWHLKTKKIPGGIYLHSTGTLTHVWESFDPEHSPTVADRAGTRGSDQGWMSYCLWPAPKAWTAEDGVYSLKWLSGPKLPKHVRVVSTPGFDKPWLPETQRKHPWIREHWKL